MKAERDLQKTVNVMEKKVEVKPEMDAIKNENQDMKQEMSSTHINQMYPEGVHRVITQNQQMSLQVRY